MLSPLIKKQVNKFIIKKLRLSVKFPYSEENGDYYIYMVIYSPILAIFK